MTMVIKITIRTIKNLFTLTSKVTTVTLVTEIVVNIHRSSCQIFLIFAQFKENREVSSNLEKSSVSIFILIRSWKSRWFKKTDVQTDRHEEFYIRFWQFLCKST